MVDDSKKSFMNVESEAVIIKANSPSYKVGDVAELEITSPFSPCDGMMSFDTNESRIGDSAV